MRKVVRHIFTTIIIAIITVVAIVSVFILTIDPNNYRADIETAISDAIGYPIHMRGPITLKMFPLIHFAVNDILVESPPRFDTALLKIDTVMAGISIAPLLKGTLDIGKITLRRPQLNLLTQSDGTHNWKSSAPKPNSSRVALPILLVNKVTMENASIVWQDLQNNTSLKADNLSFGMGAFALNESVDVNVETTIHDEHSDIQTQFSSHANITVDTESKRIAIDGIRIDAAIYKDKKINPLPIKIQGAGIYDVSEDTITIKSAVIDSSALHAIADLKVLSVSNDAFVHFNLHEGTLTTAAIPNFLIEDTRQWPDSILVTASGTLDTKLNQIKLNALNVNVDDTNIRGSGTISPFTQTPHIDADLSVNMNTLDLRKNSGKISSNNHKPERTSANKPAPDEIANSFTDILVPLTNSYQLTLNADLTIKQLQLEELEIPDVKATIQVKQQEIKMLIPEISLFGGALAGAFSADFTQRENITWQANGEIRNFDLAQATTIFSDEKQPILHGWSTVRYQLAANGIDDTAIKKSLNGNIQVTAKNGKLFDPALEKVLREAIASLLKSPITESENILDIQTLESDITFNAGIAESKKLAASTPWLDLKGSGKTNLLSSEMDYRLLLKLNKPQSDSTIQVPLIIEGTIDEPAYMLDLPAVAKQQVEKKINKELDTTTEKLGDTISEEIGKVLDKLKLPF